MRIFSIARNYGEPDPPPHCTLCRRLREALELQKKAKKIIESCLALAAERKNNPGWDANGAPAFDYP